MYKRQNYTSIVCKFFVTREGKEVAHLFAEKRTYLVTGMLTTEAGIHTMLSGDLYAVIGDAEGSEGAFVTRLYFNPLVVWMWIGCLVMVFGALLSLTDHRYRVGAPNRSRKATLIAGE